MKSFFFCFCFWMRLFPLGWRGGKRQKINKENLSGLVFLRTFLGGGGGERCAAARLGCSLCQGYKQAVIRPPNRIIPPVSAPKHMGPHKAAAAPDRHPLLITQRRGAGPFLPLPCRPCLRVSPPGCRGYASHVKGERSHAAVL